jgi:hypothetical protein
LDEPVQIQKEYEAVKWKEFMMMRMKEEKSRLKSQNFRTPEIARFTVG